MDEDHADSSLEGVHMPKDIDPPSIKILHEAAIDRFPPTAYTDLVVRGKKEKFHCHKFIVLRQIPDLEDTLQNTIKNIFSNYDHADETIFAMLKFIYTGYYDDPFRQIDALSFHSVVYWLASIYNFQNLKESSKAKFAFCVDHQLSLEEFLECPEIYLNIVYDTPFDTGRGLKDVMLAFCARHAKELVSCERFYSSDDFPENFWKGFASHLAGSPELPGV